MELLQVSRIQRPVAASRRLGHLASKINLSRDWSLMIAKRPLVKRWSTQAAGTKRNRSVLSNIAKTLRRSAREALNFGLGSGSCKVSGLAIQALGSR